MARAGGPGGGGDPGNAGGGSSGGGRGGGGATGGGGRGNNTPGAPDGNGRGRTGGGGGGPGRDTPGSPNAPDGRRGSTMGPDGGSATGGGGRGSNTPGAPSNPGRRGAHAEGSTPSSRARDAMSRHQDERNRRSIAEGGSMIGDNDENAGLGLTHAMDSQQTENALNRSGVTDTLGMSEVDRLGEANQAGAMLSSTDRQRERGIRHGFNSQFSADRVSDITGMPGAVTDAAVGLLGRPDNTMQSDVDIGRDRARGMNIGSVGETAVSVGARNLGANVPGNVANFGIATARAAMDKNMNSLQSSDNPTNTSSAAGGGGSVNTNPGAVSAPPAAQTQSFGWAPVNIKQYSRGLIRPNMG